MMPLIERLAKELPEGFVVRLGVENGSAWVELYDNDTEVTLPDSTDRSISQQLTDALWMAKKIEASDDDCPICGEPYWKCDHYDEEFENE